MGESVRKINISIVLFHNEVQQVQNLLDDLLVQSLFINKIYLLDNSSDTTLSILANNSSIEYIELPENLGYGAAHNIAMTESMIDNIRYHLVVNPDISMFETVIADLLMYMENNLSVGLAMPDIHYPDGDRQHLCKLLPTPIYLFSRRFLPKIFSTNFDRKYNLLDINYSQEMNVPLLSGCFMFLRTSVLADVGMFDSRFFMYLEDFDLVRRIHKRYKTIFLPSVQVIHEYAKGSYKNRTLMIYHIKSAIKYFNKWGWFFDSDRNRINSIFIQKYCPHLLRK